MAKVTITIEDIGDNKVKVQATPNMETIFKMELSGETLTSAHGYAFTALNAIKKASNENSPNRILIPKTRGL